MDMYFHSLQDVKCLLFHGISGTVATCAGKVAEVKGEFDVYSSSSSILQHVVQRKTKVYHTVSLTGS